MIRLLGNLLMKYLENAAEATKTQSENPTFFPPAKTILKHLHKTIPLDQFSVHC